MCVHGARIGFFYNKILNSHYFFLSLNWNNSCIPQKSFMDHSFKKSWSSFQSTATYSRSNFMLSMYPLEHIECMIQFWFLIIEASYMWTSTKSSVVWPPFLSLRFKLNFLWYVNLDLSTEFLKSWMAPKAFTFCRHSLYALNASSGNLTSIQS